MTGEFPDLPVLAGRRFASDGVVFGAWYSSAKYQDATVRRLAERRALFVVMIDTRAFAQRFPLVQRFVASEYAPMTDIAVPGAETVHLLVDRRRVPSGVDGAGGWPCFT